jgi:hypothetical protein
MTTLPTPLVLDFIDRQLSYDPTTGIISRGGKSLGAKSSGYINLTLHLDSRYQGCSLTYTTRAHQVAWYLTYGTWAETPIDHIDGNRANNRLNNLRLATTQQNNHNARKRTKRTYTCQYKGVQWRGNTSYRAYITFDGKRYHIGTYPNEVEAALAYNAKATELFGAYAHLNTILPT